MSELTCPGCRSVMSVVRMDGGVELDVCGTCAGHWLDVGELQQLAPRPDGDVLDDLALGPTSSGPAVRRCPRCHRRLSALKSSAMPTLRIDGCVDHGVFLDPGELETVKAFAASGALPMPPLPEPVRARRDRSEPHPFDGAPASTSSSGVGAGDVASFVFGHGRHSDGLLGFVLDVLNHR